MLARVHPRAAVVCRFALGLAIAVDAYYVRALSAAPVAAAVSLAAVAALAFLTRRAGSWAPAHWLFAATGLAVSCVLVVAVPARQPAPRSWIGAASASATSTPNVTKEDNARLIEETFRQLEAQRPS